MLKQVGALFGVPAETPQVCIVGTQASAKTTFLAALDLLCTDLSNQNPQGFAYMLHEFGRFSGSFQGLKTAQSNLIKGRFPEKTPPSRAYEAIAMMKWKHRTGIGWSHLTVPVVETAGESISQLIDRFGQGQYTTAIQSMTSAEGEMLSDKILNSDGFVLCCPVTRAISWAVGDEMDPILKDSEPENLPDDPDINMFRLIQCIVQYRENVQNARKIKGIYCLLTKYDALMMKLKAIGYDLETPIGIERFMSQYYRNTWSALKFYSIKARTFPFWVWVEKDPVKGNPIRYDDGYHIQIDPKTARPVYSGQWLHRFIEALREDFAS